MSTQYVELSDYLEHHGIKGQKWGVEHGPPYPLKTGVSARIKRAAKSARSRVEQNRKQRAARQEAKDAKRRQKNPTLQDKINTMSNEELREKTERLKLENAYKRELPREKEGESFLKESANLMNNLKLFGDAFAGLVRTGKDIGKLFGMTDDTDSDYDWSKRKPGETAKQYSDRLNALRNIRRKTQEFKNEDEKAKKVAEEERQRAAAEKRAKEAQEKYDREEKKRDKKNRRSGVIAPWNSNGRF